MRVLGALLSAVALAVVLGACDPDEEATDPAALARSIDRATAAAGTAHAEIAATIGNGAEITGEGDLRIDPDETAMVADIHSVRGHSRFVCLDGTVYFKPRVGENTGPWIGFELTGEGGTSRETTFMVRDLRVNADPHRMIEQLRTAGTITGEERGVELNGERTTHYRVTVAVAELAERDPLVRAMERTGIKDFPIELWIGEDTLPVRVKTGAPGLHPDKDETYDSDVVVDYADWGAPVTITAPEGEIQWVPAD